MAGEHSGTDLNRKTSATNTNGQTKVGADRSVKAITLSGGTVVTEVTQRFGAIGSIQGLFGAYGVPTEKQEKSTVVAEDKPSHPRNKPPEDFKYNLPPHAWSLPVRPVDVIGSDQVYSKKKLDLNEVHSKRRGVIWFWDSQGAVSALDKDDSGNVVAKTARQKEAEVNKNTGVVEDPLVNKYGFQFLWNPETISSSVERNMDVTPSSADRLRTVAGAFPGQESYSFTITLDRVNDFACIKQLADSPGQFLYPEDLYKYYKYGIYPRSVAQMTADIDDLSRLGTMADIEYLYKAINGNGDTNGKGWHTLLDKPTAAIGFLAPQLLAFSLGPNPTESLSFVGWITSLSFSHTYFTESMIPLRTNVNFSCQAFAGASIT